MKALVELRQELPFKEGGPLLLSSGRGFSSAKAGSGSADPPSKRLKIKTEEQNINIIREGEAGVSGYGWVKALDINCVSC